MSSETRPLSPQLKESHKFIPQELSAEEIPELPDNDVLSALQRSSTTSTALTADSGATRRKRRDSLKELDIINISNYKAKITASRATNLIAEVSPVPKPVDSAPIPAAAETAADETTSEIDMEVDVPEVKDAAPVAPELKSAVRRVASSRRRSSMFRADLDELSGTLTDDLPPTATRSSRRSSIAVSRDAPMREDMVTGSISESSSEVKDKLEEKPVSKSKKTASKPERKALQQSMYIPFVFLFN